MSARQVRRLRALKGQLKASINTSADGATVEMPIGSARSILEELDWLIREETNHTDPAELEGRPITF